MDNTILGMKLYHGTSIEALKRIKKEGILPRHKSGAKSNWKYGNGKGRHDLVYLSNCYPAYYAQASERDTVGFGLILEIELPDDSMLYPDEEFLMHALRYENGEKIYKQMEDINPFDYQEHWQKSLDYMGTIAIEEIDLKCILGYYKVKDMRDHLSFGDPLISTINYKICSPEYKARLAEVKFTKLKT